MEPSRRLGIFVAIFTFLVKVCADINCQLFQNEVVCVADVEDYIVRKGVFSGATQATKITLANCRITDLEDLAFEDVFYLQDIDLSKNKISNLSPRVFDGIVYVTHLNLSYNLLTTIPTGLFDQKPNLLTLDLRGNRINTLPSDVFVALRKLERLDLSDNDFLGKDLSPYLFGRTRKLKYLDFSRNVMTNSPDNLFSALQELDTLIMDRCSLVDVPQFATKANLRTMTHLKLSTNQITKLSQPRTFMEFIHLEVLDLTANLIDSVAANIFIYLKGIKVIILRDNKLKILPDGFFRNLAKLTHVDLSHNMLEYVPLNAFRGTAIQDLNLSHNRFSYLDVYFCSQLRHSGIGINNLHIGDNPWQCACLNDVLKEMKNFGIGYDGNKYDGRHTVCVTTKKFTCNREIVDNYLFVEMYDNTIKNTKQTDQFIY